MKPDNSPTTNKNILIHELQNVVVESFTSETSTGDELHGSTSIIIDGIALVQEMVVYKKSY